MSVKIEMIHLRDDLAHIKLLAMERQPSILSTGITIIPSKPPLKTLVCYGVQLIIKGRFGLISSSEMKVGCLKTSLLGHDLKGIQSKTTADNVLYYRQSNNNKQDRKLVLG
jgi:hypothetical protein